MMFLQITAAAALSLPQMVPIQDDYPTSALRRDQSAAALVEIVVDPNGERVACATLATFGDDKLAQQICSLQAKAKLQAAKDAAGNPAFGVLRVLIRYSIIQTEEGREIYRLEAPGYTFTVTGIRFRSGERPPEFAEFEAQVGARKNVLKPDAFFTAEAMPGVQGTALHLNLIVKVGTDGTVTECQKDTKFGTSEYSAYSKAACSYLANTRLEPLVVSGEPVAHVRRLEVQFSLPEPPTQGN